METAEKKTAGLLPNSSAKNLFLAHRKPQHEITSVFSDARRDFGAGAGEFYRYLDSLKDLGPASFGGRALSLIREIVYREVGIGGFDNALGQFFEKLRAGVIHRSYFRDFIAALQNLSGDFIADNTFQNISEYNLTDLEYFINWFLRRRWLIDRSELRFKKDVEEILAIEIEHDVVNKGVAGILVTAAASLVGRQGKPLWFKVFVLNEGKPLVTRDGWSLWCDHTDTVYLASKLRQQPFAAIAPLIPDSQSAIIDDITVFVPYDALKLQSGRQYLTMDVGIYDARGRVICAAKEHPGFYITAGVGVSSDSSPLSPQALSLWPEDPVRGHKIISLSVEQSVSSDSDGYARETLLVKAAVQLGGCKGQIVPFEIRFIDRDGNIVEIVRRGGNEPYIGRFDLLPVKDLQRFENLVFEVPVHALSLESGSHHLICEATLYGQNGETIAGDLVPADIVVREEHVEVFDQDIEYIVNTGGQRGIQLEGISINPSRLNLYETVRIESVFNVSSFVPPGLIVVCGLEDYSCRPFYVENGDKKLLKKSVLLYEIENPGTVSAVFNFDYREFSQALTAQKGSITLVAHLQLFVRGVTAPILEFRRNFEFKLRDALLTTSFGSLEGRAIYVADIQVEYSRVGSSVDVVVRLNANSKRLPLSGTVFCEVVDYNGNPVSGEHAHRENASLQGVSESYSVEALPQSIFAGVSWLQDELKLRVPLPADMAVQSAGQLLLKFLLFSQKGKLEQVIYHQLPEMGPRLTVEYQEPEFFRERRLSKEGSSAFCGSKRKRFWSRFF
ncbi:MAG: hypothetical protein D6719_12490 [Candidatus Dadabacteria bacterium]|nr:MAG: hypothetical protein D6719_12490 [Candidatus Dadabacteria bacterium]